MVARGLTILVALMAALAVRFDRRPGGRPGRPCSRRQIREAHGTDAKGKVLRSYSIALGGNPLGHKQQQGDERTPEGRYVLDWRNPNSCCMRSLHISYPNAADKAAAKQTGRRSPGGMIMIHGQVNGFGWWGWLTAAVRLDERLHCRHRRGHGRDLGYGRRSARRSRSIHERRKSAGVPATTRSIRTRRSGRIEPISAGLRGRCPRCGEGRLFSGFLTVGKRCGELRARLCLRRCRRRAGGLRHPDHRLRRRRAGAVDGGQRSTRRSGCISSSGSR